MQRIINHLRPGLTSRRTTSYLMALVSLLAVVALMGSLMGCDGGGCSLAGDDLSTSSTSTAQTKTKKPSELVITDIDNSGSPAGNPINVTATAPGPPYPERVEVTWHVPKGATNVQTNPPPTDCYLSALCW